jgi:hypothetical protein
MWCGVVCGVVADLFATVHAMSALPPKADIHGCGWNVHTKRGSFKHLVTKRHKTRPCDVNGLRAFRKMPADIRNVRNPDHPRLLCLRLGITFRALLAPELLSDPIIAMMTFPLVFHPLIKLISLLTPGKPRVHLPQRIAD